MVTRPRKPPKKAPSRYLYIEEHMEAKGLGADELAKRMGVHRQTVYKWLAEQSRLRPERIADLSIALGLAHPEQLWRPPNYSRLDDMTVEELLAEVQRRVSKRD